MRRAQALLAKRSSGCWVAVVGVILTLPSLGVGLKIDDYFHRTAIHGSKLFADIATGPMDMFRFFNGDPERTHGVMENGCLPWYTYEGIKASFWRPLTTLTHWIDYQLWPDTPWLMHLQSIAWYAAVILCVAACYRRFAASAWIAGFAALLYAIDDGHGMAVGFLANRNVLLSACFGVLAIVIHDRWRRGDWRAGAVIAPCCLMLSLLAKEAGIATCAYLASYAIFLDRGTPVRRMLHLLPYAAVVVAWRVMWEASGAGFADAGLYIDPLRDPARFLSAVIERAPMLMLGQWGTPPAEIGILLQARGLLCLWAAGVVLSLIVVYALTPILRARAESRFWFVGMLLALIPICSTFPSDRLLFFVGLGACPLLARIFVAAFGARSSPVSRSFRARFTLVLGVVFVLIHIALPLVGLPLRAANPTGPKSIEEQFTIRLALDESVAKQDLLIINPPSVLHAAYFPLQQEFAGKPLPRRTRLLAPGFEPVRVERSAENQLIIRPANGFMSWRFERLFRNELHAFKKGDRVLLSRMTIEILEMSDDERPAAVSFTMDAPLESPTFRWIKWADGEFVDFKLPPLGATHELPGPPKLF